MKPPVEIEAKFYLTDLQSFEARVRSIGASLVRPRTWEQNYRFDTPGLDLAREHRVLRLRQDNAVVLTYKGPSEVKDNVAQRPEIEFEVGDFDAAYHLLEALGFCLSVKYEKWRTIYQLGEMEIALDEMPFGNFSELEGGSPALIQRTAAILALDWNAAITHSYLVLFDHLKTNKKLDLHHLTFDEFLDLNVSAKDLGVKPADLPRYL